MYNYKKNVLYIIINCGVFLFTFDNMNIYLGNIKSNISNYIFTYIKVLGI